MKELIIQIAQALVDQPDRVQVTEIASAQTVILELKVAKGDIGKVIGKHGKTAFAIRTLLQSVSGKTRKKYVLDIID